MENLTPSKIVKRVGVIPQKVFKFYRPMQSCAF